MLNPELRDELINEHDKLLKGDYESNQTNHSYAFWSLKDNTLSSEMGNFPIFHSKLLHKHNKHNDPTEKNEEEEDEEI